MSAEFLIVTPQQFADGYRTFDVIAFMHSSDEDDPVVTQRHAFELHRKLDDGTYEVYNPFVNTKGPGDKPGADVEDQP